MNLTGKGSEEGAIGTKERMSLGWRLVSDPGKGEE
jgi:hypothetical protein